MAEDRLQRRLAAILAADVVGYSRLMELDEVGTWSALKARRKEIVSPLVAQHQGRVFKVTGDGIMVEFGSAVNAVQCAIDVQQAMAAAAAGQPEDRRIVLRIGINLGDVMVEAWRSLWRRRQHRRAPGDRRGARRHLCLRHCVRPGPQQVRDRLRGARRAEPQEYRCAGARLSRHGPRAPADRAAPPRRATSHPSPSCLSPA